MPGLGRTLILLGLLLLTAGLVTLALNRLNLPLGRLPGDIHLCGGNWSSSFPIVTCLLLSALLSLALWIAGRMRR